jgi:HK97 family phage major capsid protein
MPSPKLCQLQDEAATLSKTIADLRSVEPHDDADAASIADRLAAAERRADEVAAAAKRERDLDARIAALQSVSAASEPRSVVDADDKAPEAVDIRSGVRAFSSIKAAQAVGLYLRAMFTGETRALGETTGTYANLGAEYVSTELYNAIVNRLAYSSVALQLATVVRPNAQKISFPKVGDATASFVAEGTATTDQDIATSASDLTLYEMRASVAVSRSLIEDSPIDVAGLVAERFSLAYATKFDSTWLAGNNANPAITGLAASVANGNTVTVAANASTTVANLADVVGKVDETIMGSAAWVCSKAGWVDLMKLWSAQQTTLTVGGGRIVPSIFGSPVYIVKGLPATTLALYGDFAMATAVGVKANGLEIEAGREILMRNRQVLYVANTRFGVVNHAPEFVARLAKGA